MSIKREDLDAGPIDTGEPTSGRRTPPTHPGDVLHQDFLLPMGISVHALSNAIKMPRSRVNDIVLGRRAIDADTALRLARHLGTTPEFWISLQARYDQEVVKQGPRARTEKQVEPRAT